MTDCNMGSARVTRLELRVTSSGHHCGAQVRACSRQLFGSVDKERRAGGEGGTLLRGNPLCWLSTGGAEQGGVAGRGVPAAAAQAGSEPGLAARPAGGWEGSGREAVGGAHNNRGS